MVKWLPGGELPFWWVLQCLYLQYSYLLFWKFIIRPFYCMEFQWIRFIRFTRSYLCNTKRIIYLGLAFLVYSILVVRPWNFFLYYISEIWVCDLLEWLLLIIQRMGLSSLEMVLPRRILILVSGTRRNIWNKSRNIGTMIHTEYSYLTAGLQQIFKKKRNNIVMILCFLLMESWS